MRSFAVAKENWEDSTFNRKSIREGAGSEWRYRKKSRRLLSDGVLYSMASVSSTLEKEEETMDDSARTGLLGMPYP